MDALDSSPLKRLGTFVCGLLTFAAFGLLAMFVFKLSGGDSDPEYEKRAGERLEIRENALAAQAEKLKTFDLAGGTAAIAARKAAPSQKPAPGTKAFEEWMAAQAAAAAAAAPDGGTESAEDADAVKITLNAMTGGVMKYVETELTAPAGSKVVLTFNNPDVLQHNFLLLKPGTKEAVGALADAMAADPEALAKGYIPESDDILAHSKLLNPTTSDVVRFNVPAEPGDYPYICTFPGHWRLMQGVFKVTEAGTPPPAPPENATPPKPAEAGGDSVTPPTPPAEPAVVKLKLEALPGGVMKYKQTELTVKAGSKVELTFINPDVLQHNFLLLKPGTKDKVGALADGMLTDPEAMKKQYVPESDDILAHTDLVNPAASTTINFTVPNEPGDYPYICTFPGHWRLMFGNLKVTP